MLSFSYKRNNIEVYILKLLHLTSWPPCSSNFLEVIKFILLLLFNYYTFKICIVIAFITGTLHLYMTYLNSSFFFHSLILPSSPSSLSHLHTLFLFVPLFSFSAVSGSIYRWYYCRNSMEIPQETGIKRFYLTL